MKGKTDFININWSDKTDDYHFDKIEKLVKSYRKKEDQGKVISAIILQCMKDCEKCKIPGTIVFCRDLERGLGIASNHRNIAELYYENKFYDDTFKDTFKRSVLLYEIEMPPVVDDTIENRFVDVWSRFVASIRIMKIKKKPIDFEEWYLWHNFLDFVSKANSEYQTNKAEYQSRAKHGLRPAVNAEPEEKQVANPISILKVQTVVLMEILKKAGVSKANTDLAKIVRLIAYLTGRSENKIYNEANKGINFTGYHTPEIERVNKLLSEINIDISINKDNQY